MRSVYLLLSLSLQLISAQYYVVNYPQQSQQYYPQPQYQQIYKPQPVYQTQFVQQQYPQQQYFNQVPQQVQYIQQQPQQYVPQQVAPQPQQQYQVPQQQYQQPANQQYQQVQQVPQQQYQPQPQQPQQQYQQQQYQQQAPQPQQTERSVVDTTINEKNVKIVSANTYEFDLPPPPPSRFLPDEERVKIIQANKQGRPEHTKMVRPQRPHTRINNHERRTNELNTAQLNRVSSSDSHQKPLPTTATPTTTPSTTTTEASTTAPEGNEPVSHLSPRKDINPNKIFLQCCKTKKVAKSCESRCNFDNINKKVLTAMFLGTDPCPQRYGLDLFACAAQESDHTACCRTKNVQRTSAGEKCLAFCNLRPDSNFQADASYLPCWAVLNDVRSCFKDAILEGDH